MNWMSSIIAVVSLLVAFGSLVVAIGAYRTSRAALAESRRKHSLDIRPALAVVTERHQGRGGNYYHVHVQNSGPGVAHKVSAALNWESLVNSKWGDRPVMATAESLPPQGRLALPDEAPCTVADKDRICGIMTCEDAAGIRYWWRRVGPAAEWQSGTGSLPHHS